MNGPQMHAAQRLDEETWLLPSLMPIPGAGFLSVNAALIRGAQPILVDTGLAALSADFLTQLENCIDPGELRWLWLTHTDADHTGSYAAVLERAPKARVVTNFIGMAKLGLLGLPSDRVLLLNPGQSLDAGDRTLTALRPPVYDAPETMGFLDSKTRTLYSADSFGALLDAGYEHAMDVDSQTLRAGMAAWARVDAPWLEMVPEGQFAAALENVRQLDPTRVLSAHLPPAIDMMSDLTAHLMTALEQPEFVGPDQKQFEAMMAATPASA